MVFGEDRCQSGNAGRYEEENDAERYPSLFSRKP